MKSGITQFGPLVKKMTRRVRKKTLQIMPKHWMLRDIFKS